MTVQNTTPAVTFVGTGAQTSFPFTFRCDDVAWLSVDYLTNFDQFLLNPDQDANPGGSVEYTVAPPLNQELTVIRATEQDQQLDYTRYDPFDSESHEDALDKLTMIVQDQQYTLSVLGRFHPAYITSLDYGDPTVPDVITNQIIFRSRDLNDYANLGFDGGSAALNLDNLAHGAGIQLRAETAAGALVGLFAALPDGVAQVFHAGVATAMTAAAGAGGFEVNNLATGVGFERVLTVSDIAGGAIDHGTLGGLGDDDHPQYHNGTLAYTGNLNMGGFDIINVGLVDGVDLAADSATLAAHVADLSIHFTEASIDHLNILNSGVNSHGVIDSHIANSAIHFTVGSIDHTAISNIGVNSHAVIDAHIADPTIHFTQGSIDHILIANVGTNTHAQIDTHIADTTIHFADAPADGNIYGRINNGWAQVTSGFNGLGVWRYRTATDAFPTAGRLQFDNIIIDSATNLYVNEVNDGSTDMSSFLALLVSGDLIYIQVQADSSQFVIVEIGTPVLNADVWTFPLTQVEGQGSPPSNNTPVGLVVSAGAGGGVTDHFLLTNIGVNTHVQIDTHIADTTIHPDITANVLVTGSWGFRHPLSVNALEVGSSPPVAADAFTAQLRFANIINTNQIGYVGFNGIGGNLGISNEAHGGNVFIGAEDAAGVPRVLATFDPDLNQAIFPAAVRHTSVTEAFGTNVVTTAERTALTDVAGLVVFDSDIGQLHQNDGAGWSIPGAGLTTLQDAYDNSAGVNPMIELLAASGAFTIRDGVVPLADMFELQNNAGVDFFQLDATSMDYGLNGNREFEFLIDATGRGGIRFMPDGRTQTTVAAISAAITWDSLVISNVPGGAPFGNDSAPAAIAWVGEVRFDDPPSVFATSLLFNQATLISCNGVNVGPVYTMVNQPRVRNIAAGSRTMSQANAVRSQMAVGPNTAGNMTLTSHEPFFATVQVDATVGTASVTTCNYFAPKAPTLTAGGTIGTLNCFDIPDIPAAGITTLRGINSAMNSGDFINHTGTAESNFGGPINLTNDFPNGVLRMGASNDYSQGWVATGEFYQQVGTPFVTQWRWSAPATGRLLMQGTGAVLDELNINVNRFSMGAQSGAVGNQVGVFVAGARTTQVAGEWSDFLLTQAANLTVDDAMGGVFGWTINAPSMTLGTGSVTTAGALNIGGNVNQGSVNRFGVRILSNPSGGSGVNAALWVTAGLTRLDGRLDINNGQALGGGGTALLGTVGGTGPTGTAQAQWVEIDIGGVAHWIPVWT